jgi:fructose-1-phosphate kinase PfkB-like protein
MRAMATAAVRCAAWLIPPNDEEVREIVDRMMETDEIRELLRP